VAEHRDPSGHDHDDGQVLQEDQMVHLFQN
jgi:hypothetical protein